MFAFRSHRFNQAELLVIPRGSLTRRRYRRSFEPGCRRATIEACGSITHTRLNQLTVFAISKGLHYRPLIAVRSFPEGDGGNLPVQITITHFAVICRNTHQSVFTIVGIPDVPLAFRAAIKLTCAG